MTVTDAPPIISRDAAHHYFYDGVQYPGVTTILDVLDKSRPLMTWAARQTAEAAVEMAKVVVNDKSMLQHLMDSTGEEGAVKALTSRSNWKRDEAAQLGTEVHDLADRMIRGEKLPIMTPTQLARVEHYTRWWEGEQKQGAKLRLSEAMILQPNYENNPESGWGGTFDLLYYDADGATVLADIKTGGKWGRKVYESEVLQLTAYGMGRLVQPSTDGLTLPSVYPMPMPNKYKVIHVTGEGCKAIPVDITQRDRMAFLACLDLHHWVQNLKGKKLMPFEVKGYTPVVAPGIYQAVCTGISEKSPKNDPNSVFLVWEFTLRDGTGRAVNGSSSTKTTGTTKGAKWLAALLGEQPALGAIVEPVGKTCTIIVAIKDTTGYEYVESVAVAEQAAPRSPVRPLVEEPLAQGETGGQAEDSSGLPF